MRSTPLIVVLLLTSGCLGPVFTAAEGALALDGGGAAIVDPGRVDVGEAGDPPPVATDGQDAAAPDAMTPDETSRPQPEDSGYVQTIEASAPAPEAAPAEAAPAEAATAEAAPAEAATDVEDAGPLPCDPSACSTGCCATTIACGACPVQPPPPTCNPANCPVCTSSAYPVEACCTSLGTCGCALYSDCV
jgi:hypothetical protein